MSKTKTVIVIDDSEAVRMTIGHWFNQRKINFIEAKDGREGYQKIKENINQLDLIISDYNMPEMNGGELFFKLEQDELGSSIMKVLLTTETPKKETLDFTKITNFKGWILKPLSENKFTKIMKAMDIF